MNNIMEINKFHNIIFDKILINFIIFGGICFINNKKILSI